MRRKLLLVLGCACLAACGPVVTGDSDGGDVAGDAGGQDASGGGPAGVDTSDGGTAAVDTSEPSDMPAIPTTVSKADATCSNGRRVRVSAAVDGDTLQLSNYVTRNGETARERVRMIGMNTPESVASGPIQCYGPESSTYTHAAMTGQWICLTYDPAVTTQSDNLDQYGRTLGYIFYGKNAQGEDDYHRFYNAELVWKGYAKDYPFTRGAVYASYLKSLKNAAYNAKRGLWGACY